MLKGISGNKHTAHFALYNWNQRDHFLHSIIARLPTDVQRLYMFIIDKYIETFPCIHLSASGESTNSTVVVYSSLVVVYFNLVVVYSSLVCLQ